MSFFVFFKRNKEKEQSTKQEEAYLISTLLRAAGDNVWIAPLLINKNR